MGLIAVKMDIEGFYGTQDRRTKKSTTSKVVPPHVHSVSSRDLRLYRKEGLTDGSPSADRLRIEHPRGRSAKGKRST
jgi:hypothetical protein